MQGGWHRIILLGLALLLAGCDLSALMPTPFQFPTLTPAPTGTKTSTPLPSPTPTATPTRVTPVAIGTALPQAQSHTGDLAGSLTLLAEWGSGLPQQIAWSPEGAWLAVASSRGVQVYDSGTLEMTHMLFRGKLARSLAFSADGTLLAVGLDSGEGAVFNLKDGRMLWRAVLSGTPVLSLAFSPDGSLLAAGAVGGGVSLWQAESGINRSAPGAMRWAVEQAAFIREGEMLLTWNPREQPYLWRVVDGKRVDDFYIGANPGGGSASGLSVSVDGALVAAAQGARVRLMRGSNNTTLATLANFPAPVQALAASADGSTIAAAVTGEVQVWAGQPVALAGRVSLGAPAESVRLALSPNGSLLAVLGDRLQVWKVAGSQVVQEAGTVYATDFILSGSLDAPASAWWSGASDGSLLPHDLTTGILAGEGIRLGTRPAAVVHSPSGGWVAVAQGVNVLVWQAAAAGGSASLRFKLTGHELAVTSLALSPDGRWLASGSADATVRLWDLSDGSTGAELPVGEAVSWVMFSPRGDRLATCVQQRIRIWDAENGELLDEFDGYALAFHPDGELLAVAGFDQREAVVWARKTGEREPLATVTARAHRLAFSPGGERLLAAGDMLHILMFPGMETLAEVGLSSPLREAIFMDGGARVLGVAWDGVLSVYGAP